MKAFEGSDRPMGGDDLPRRVADGLAKLGRALRHHSWHDGLPRGLTPTQGEILVYLASHPGARLQEVAANLGVRAATASEAVRTLVAKGWVEKSRSLEDARALVLRLTVEGRDLAARSDRWPELLASVVAELDGARQRVLLDAIIEMIRRLHESGAISVARLCVTCAHFQPHLHGIESDRPHHCGLIDSPLAADELRVDCPEQEPASPSRLEAIRRSFADLQAMR